MAARAVPMEDDGKTVEREFYGFGDQEVRGYIPILIAKRFRSVTIWLTGFHWFKPTGNGSPWCNRPARMWPLWFSPIWNRFYFTP